MRFTVFTRSDDFSKSLGDHLKETIAAQQNWVYDPQKPALVICVGGDGTLLRAIHAYEERLDETLFTAIHTGTLGFFTDYTKNEIDEFLSDLLHKEPVTESYPLIEAVLDDGRVFRALNEIRIGSFSNTVYYDIFIDDEFFESISSCGLCVSTQAGSTGANRALRGAVVENGLNVLEMAQIMPVDHINHHSLTSPYIMNRDRRITLKGKSIEESILCHDHLVAQNLKGVFSIDIHLCKRSVRFARYRPYSYLKRLRNLF